MSKLICEYCGTIYENEQGECPVCGHVNKPEEAAEPAAPQQPQKTGGAPMDDTIVAMGKLLSQTNQAAEKKAPEPQPEAPREKTPPAAPVPPQPEKPSPKKAEAGGTKAQPQRRKPAKKRASKRDKVVCGVLAVLVVGFALFIGYRFLRPYLFSSRGEQMSATGQEESTAQEVPCTGVTADAAITLTAAGETWQLNVALTPADTTDEAIYISDAPQVATVNTQGLVQAMGNGTANITVTCGTATATCAVTCSFTEPEPVETTAPTEETEPTTYELNLTDVSFFGVGESVRLRIEGVDSGEVTWSSKDSSIATVSGEGKVTAVAPGTTRVIAAYQGQELDCIVRCNFEEPGETEASEDAISLSHTDVTLVVDESFTLRLKDGDGNTLDVDWSVGNTGVCTVSGNTVTAVGEGYTEVSCTYFGVTYTCIVRVRGE